MDAHEVERRLAEDAARFDQETAEFDEQTFADEMLTRLGIQPGPQDTPGDVEVP